MLITLKRSLWLRILLSIFVVFSTVVLGVEFLRGWYFFHPTYSAPIVGPAGSKNRAFVADIGGFGLCELLVSASDWPHTFSSPFVLGDIFRADLYDSSDVFWSQDGSVLVFRVKPHDQSDEVFEAAYDFETHTALNRCPDQITALVQVRGGPGPRSDVYSDSGGTISLQGETKNR